MVVPKYKELSVKKIWEFVKDEEDIMVYFPDYKETELPPRDFLITILTTYNKEAMAELVTQARNKRSITLYSNNDNLIEITQEIKDSIQNSNIMKSKHSNLLRILKLLQTININSNQGISLLLTKAECKA